MTVRRWFSSLGLRVRTLFRKRHVERELGEELQFHVDRQVEMLVAEGLSAPAARRVAMKSLGGVERQMERCREVWAWHWVEVLGADVRFGWRQLMKRKVTTAVAVLSLGLGIGSCVAAFRLVDAMMLRPLPIRDAQRLYAVHFAGFTPEGKPAAWDPTSYPVFQQMRAAVKGKAELIAIHPAERMDLTYGSDQEMERAVLQYVSGWMFPTFGVRPALGRLFTEDDDREPGVKPYAVISHAYWMNRFGGDPKVIGRSFRMGSQVFQIIGISEKSFTGTEPGTIPDVYVPTMMNRMVSSPNQSWIRVFVKLNPGVAIEPVRAQMYGVYRAYEQKQAKAWVNLLPAKMLEGFPREQMLLKPAGSGVSLMQENYRQALLILSVLVLTVLLIACANVANLMTAQAASRAREIALRVSIGAGRLRLVQMVLVESVILALLSAAFGALFAVWAAPFVVSRINPPDNPVQLILPMDWRVLGFGLLLSVGVALMFGLIPALRASSTKPVSALKGGEEPHARRRTMYGLIAAQVAFCFVVLFLAGLFVKTLRGLEDQPLGFSAERILLMDTVAQHAQSPIAWQQALEDLKATPGVEAAAIAEWGLVSGSTENTAISLNDAPPNEVLCDLLFVSPGWLATMKVPLVYGRDIRANEVYPRAAIVNRAFARQYFGGANPVGKSFGMGSETKGKPNHLEIVGMVENVVYEDIHRPVNPMAFVPASSINATGDLQPIHDMTFVVRTSSANPMLLAQSLRQEVQQARSEFRVRNVTTQAELVRAQTIRERLLATLAGFFAVVALLLAAIGLYGVLNYSVLQREKEIGIRIALGAAAGNIARIVTTRVAATVFVGVAAGLIAGVASVRFVETLLYGVKGTDASMIALPAAVLLAAARLAALPAVLRAVRIDPAEMLRAE